MFPTVKVHQRTKIGEIAESEIEKQLKSISNPMKPAYDIGIDFCCELLINGSPSGDYFLVQAKGTKKFGKEWRRYFDNKTINYWLSQSFPVFLIIYELDSKVCYWASIHENRNKLILKIGKGKKVPISVNRSKTFEKEAFIEQIKKDLASIGRSIDYSRGFPQFIGNGYVKKIPLLLLPDWLIHNIGGNIRLSTYTLASHYFYFTSNYDKAYLLCKFLTRFDESHYDHFVLMGRICKSLGLMKEAKISYIEAIKICKKDTRWDTLKSSTDPSIADLISLIEYEMKTLQ